MLPLLATHFGADASVAVAKRGYFPRGGGDVELSVLPSTLRPLHLVDAGQLVCVKAIIRTFGYASSSVLADTAHLVRGMSLPGDQSGGGKSSKEVPIEIEQYAHFSVTAQEGRTAEGAGGGRDNASETNTGSSGNSGGKRKQKNKRRRAKKKTPTTFSIQLVATTSTGCFLSANASGQKVGNEKDIVLRAIHELESLIASGSCADEHTQDQLVIFMAMAEGTSTLRCSTPKMSKHADTAMHFAALLTGAKFEVTDEDNGTRNITCSR